MFPYRALPPNLVLGWPDRRRSSAREPSRGFGSESVRRPNQLTEVAQLCRFDVFVISCSEDHAEGSHLV
jgi:hypothetical protein